MKIWSGWKVFYLEFWVELGFEKKGKKRGEKNQGIPLRDSAQKKFSCN